MLKVYLALTGCMVFLSCIVAWLFSPIFVKGIQSAQSPLPEFLTKANNKEVTTLDLWLPVQGVSRYIHQSPLNLTAKSALAYDITTDMVVYEKNASDKLPMASITKIMTAIIALEHPQNPDLYIVTSDALVGEDSMGLSAGETLSLQELLYGLLLHSANDAAEVLAFNFHGGREAFIRAMNQKAAALALTNTHFTNPSGLEGEGDQHTTAYDLVALTRYALQTFPAFRNTVATISYTLAQSRTHKEYDLENETNLLATYPGVRGVKTGFTNEAGLCLVTYLEYGGHQIIGVVLGSENRRDDMKEMLDYSLNKLGITPPKHE
jgi:D-alanyl-D-alanine carboxypeptidase (penicillin-binding protein 5/6)